jgi:exo-1,4-beta-D-glucosaminidase
MQGIEPGISLGLLLLLAAALCLVSCGGPSVATHHQVGGWALRAAAEVDASGEAISQPDFDSGDWLSGRAPTTVMAAMVADGQYPDLYMGTNLEKVPVEQFAGPWWYRTELSLTGAEAGRVARLVLDGINYSANIWLNGTQIATREQTTGAFRRYELEVTGKLKPGSNAIAVEVFPPEPGDFTIGFVDWNPRPPDQNMGIWRPVTLRLSGQVSLSQLHVASEFDLPALDRAELTVSAVVRNHGQEELRTTVSGTIEEILFCKEVVLAPGETQQLVFTPEEHEQLGISSPRLWWPHTMGEPKLYAINLEAVVDGKVSDRTETSFGIRELSTYLNPEGHRGFKVNGHEVLIRGGGWVDDLLLSDTAEKIEAQLAYVKHIGLNTIRLEGFWGSDHTLYDIADREGILIMAGWSCQWEWQDYLGKPVDETYGGVIEPADMELVAASLADQIGWLRNHPSIFTWVLASDLLPHPDLERKYEQVLAGADPTRPPLVSCGWYESEVSGPTGVKMNGPYDWVPPIYWYQDRQRGGAYGFNTETGPGPQPPPLEGLKRMIPLAHLWPPDEVWNFHCGRNEFNDADRFIEALDQRYGESESLEEFLRKSQVASYEAIRPMFEGFAVRRPLATGVIQWMLNSAWPEMYWQLYDHDLLPNGAFYGARAACRPISLAYDYEQQAVFAVNDTISEQTGLIATLRALDLQSQEIFSETRKLDLKPGSSHQVSGLDGLQPATPVYFLDLRLSDAGGTELARSFYWLPATGDELDHDASLWFVTPVKHFADLTALDQLPDVSLDVAAELAPSEDGSRVTVKLANPAGVLAFFVELRIVDGDDRSYLPVLWDDNYVSLLPGEERSLTARLPGLDNAKDAVLKLNGWNLPAMELALGQEGNS